MNLFYMRGTMRTSQPGPATTTPKEGGVRVCCAKNANKKNRERARG